MITNIVKLNKELSAIKVKLEGNDGEKRALEEKLKALEEKLTKMEADKKELESMLEDYKKEEIATVVKTEENANKKVVQTMASLGVAEGVVAEEVKPPISVEPTEIYKKFETLAGQERIKFFKDNYAVIMKAMKAVHFDTNPLSKQGIKAQARF